jgi:hypothetical protein
VRRELGRDGKIERRRAGVLSAASQDATCRNVLPAETRKSSIAARSTRSLTGSCISILARGSRSEHRCCHSQGKSDRSLFGYPRIKVSIRRYLHENVVHHPHTARLNSLLTCLAQVAATWLPWGKSAFLLGKTQLVLQAPMRERQRKTTTGMFLSFATPRSSPDPLSIQLRPVR